MDLNPMSKETIKRISTGVMPVYGHEHPRWIMSKITAYTFGLPGVHGRITGMTNTLCGVLSDEGDP